VEISPGKGTVVLWTHTRVFQTSISRNEIPVEYGTLAGNHSINRMIYECLDLISPGDVPTFVKKLRKRPLVPQHMHDYRELLVGAYLNKTGLPARYEREIGGKRPDWCLLADDGSPAALVEVATFHIAHAIDTNIQCALRSGSTWVGALGSNDERLYQVMRGKFAKYTGLARAEGLPYALALHGDFNAAVERHELNRCLQDPATGLFAQYPDVSGLLYFEIKGAYYRSTFTANPFAQRDLHIQDGLL
jgi:hypothetical protein